MNEYTEELLILETLDINTWLDVHENDYQLEAEEE